jgi:hypothetical protein
VAGLVDSIIFSSANKLKGRQDDGFSAPGGKLVSIVFATKTVVADRKVDVKLSRMASCICPSCMAVRGLIAY